MPVIIIIIMTSLRKFQLCVGPHVKRVKERRGQVIITPVPYSGGPRFKFQLGDRLS
jgi:hypothetical protein